MSIARAVCGVVKLMAEGDRQIVDGVKEKSMKQVKFDLLIEDIEKGLELYLNEINFVYMSGNSCSWPFLLIFDIENGNDYRSSVLDKATLLLHGSIDDYDEGCFRDIKTKIKATKDFIRECCKPLNKRAALIFIFWSLLAATVDKTDYNEKVALIADFSHLLKIDEKTLCDIIQVIKVICGDEEKNFEFQTKEALEVFAGVVYYAEVKSCD